MLWFSPEKKFMKVKKIWGENSWEGAKNNIHVNWDYEQWNTQALVVSAMRSDDFNTTKNLEALGWYLDAQDFAEAYRKLDEIKRFHSRLIKKNGWKNWESTKDHSNQRFEELRDVIEFWRWMDKSNPERVVPSMENDFTINAPEGRFISIKGFWEVIAAELHAMMINSQEKDWVKAKAVDLSNIIAPGEVEGRDENEVLELLISRVNKEVDDILADDMIPVLPGYIGTFPQGIDAAIWEGYSDATAAILSIGQARRLSNSNKNFLFEVHKQDGVRTADPRDVPNAKLHLGLDYTIMSEFIGARSANSKVLHPQALRDKVQQAGVHIWLGNTYTQLDDGTCIYDENRTGTMVHPGKAMSDTEVDGTLKRDRVVVFRVKNQSLSGKWFAHRLFEVVSEYGEIDVIPTGNHEITFTMDFKKIRSESKLQVLQNKIIQEFGLGDGDVSYSVEKWLLFVVWWGMSWHPGVLAKIAGTLAKNDISIDFVSQWLHQRNVSIGVNAGDTVRGVQQLHATFFEDQDLLEQDWDTIKEKVRDSWFKWFNLVECHTDTTCVSVSTSQMGKGFARDLFEAVSSFTEIWQIATSETEVTFTCAWIEKEQLKNMKRAIRDWFGLSVYSSDTPELMEFVDSRDDIDMITCYSDNMDHHVGILALMAKALSDEGINIEFITQWANEQAISIGVKKEHSARARDILSGCMKDKA